jgi:hypothetical protein
LEGEDGVAVVELAIRTRVARDELAVDGGGE